MQHAPLRPSRAAPQERTSKTCFACGLPGHYGEGCSNDKRPHLAAERNSDMRRAQMAAEEEFEKVLKQSG